AGGDGQGTHRVPVSPICSFQNENLRTFRAGTGGLGDFLEVMVVGQCVKDRHGREALLRELTREANRVESLRQGEEWSRKETDLLSGHDGNCAAARQILSHLLRFRISPAEGLRRQTRRLAEQLLAAREGGLDARSVGIKRRASEEIEEEGRKRRIFFEGDEV